MLVRELELDLDAFEGPFDLLLTLVLKEEVDLADVDVAGIVVRFVERLAEREALDLDACGEFLVLVAALLELKARGLFAEEAAELADLEPEEAAEELARRLAEYRRMKEAAAWLSERLEASGTGSSGWGRRRWRRSPSGVWHRRIRSSSDRSLRLLAAEPPSVSLNHMALRFPPVAQFAGAVPGVAVAPFPVRLRRRGCRAVARGAGRCFPGAAGAPARRRDHDFAGGAFCAHPCQ